MAKKKKIPIRGAETAKEYMSMVNDTLGCFDFKNIISIHHSDGSFFYFSNAIALVDYKKYNEIYIWTEHTGNFSFSLSDLENWIISDK